jgi:hypothetical protein
MKMQRVEDWLYMFARCAFKEMISLPLQLNLDIYILASYSHRTVYIWNSEIFKPDRLRNRDL